MKRVKLTLTTLPTHPLSVEMVRVYATNNGNLKLGTAGKLERIFVEMAECKPEDRPDWEKEWFWEAQGGKLLKKVEM